MLKLTYMLFMFVILSTIPAEMLTHRVEAGETLYSISQRYNVPLELLVSWNNINDPSRLGAGTNISIPDVYTVTAGDTLYGISRIFNISVDEIRSLNKLAGDTIVHGDTLFLPQNYTSMASNTVTEQSDSPGAVQDIVNITASSSVQKSSPTSSILASGKSGAIPLALSIDSLVFPVKGRVSERSGKMPGYVIYSELGAKVQAVHKGIVIYAGPHSSFGNVVFIQSSNSYIYVYAGQANIQVQVGDNIEAGQIIGDVGISPEINAPALYFSIWKDSRFVDAQYTSRLVN